mgnify:CR=1 FL=1
MRFESRRPWRSFVAGVLCLAMVVAACGNDDGEEDAGADVPDGGSSVTTAADAAPDLDALVEAAQQEGSVTVYSSQGVDQLDALAAAFEEEYDGISVEVVRISDGDMIPRVETELSMDQSGADLIVLAAQAWVETQAEAGSFVDPTMSPQIAGEGDYDAAQYAHEGNYFEVGAAVLTFAWNTDLVPDGVDDYPDLLDPSFADGKLAVVDPVAGPAVVDFYLWLSETFGEEYVAGLAAQDPRIYPSALPIGEAVVSGEVYAAIYAAPVQLVPAAENGAPVDFGISDEGAWGARYFGGILKSSDHPNAAALFADFMVRPLGQELVQGASGTVLPDIPGTLITNDRIRVMDLEATAPEPVAAYIEEWNGLFR